METTIKSQSRLPLLPALRGGWRCLLVVLLAQVRAADAPTACGPSVCHGDAAAARLEPENGYPALTQAVQVARYAVETVAAAGQGDAGPIRLTLETAGDLRPEPESGSTAVKFVAASGQAALRYSGLKAWDAAGRELPAHLEVQGRQLALVVKDQEAEYPVTIDPLITRQEAKLTAADGAASDNFGGGSP